MTKYNYKLDIAKDNLTNYSKKDKKIREEKKKSLN